MPRQDSPGSPGARTPSSQCRGPGFNPCGELDPICHNKYLSCHNENPAQPNKNLKEKKIVMAINPCSCSSYIYCTMEYMGSTWIKFQPHLLPTSSTLSTCSLHVHMHADTHTRACTHTAVLPRPGLMFLASNGLFGDTMLIWQKKPGWPSALALGATLSLGRMFMLPASVSWLS